MLKKYLLIIIVLFTPLILSISESGTKTKNYDSTRDTSHPSSSTISSTPIPTYSQVLDSIVPINGFPAPDGATRGLAFDGTYLWSADNGDDPHSQNGPMIYKLDPNTGAIIASYPHPGKYPNGLAWDGQYLWHSDHGTGQIYKLDPATVTAVDSFPAPGGFPFDLAYHNGFLYMVNGNTTNIFKINPSNGAVVDTIKCTYPGAERPFGLTVASTIGDGLLIAADDHNNTLNERNLITSNWINQWSSNPSVYPCGLAFDPATSTLWVSCWSKDSIWAFNVVTGIEDQPKPIAAHYFLSQNYPNPFNPVTKFRFRLPAEVHGTQAGKPGFGFVSLKVYDITGREVAVIVSEKLPPGDYEYQWDAHEFASGVYIYRLQAGQFVDVKKMILMK